MSEHLSSATRIHGDANASAAWTSYCPNSKSGSSADLGHTFCASLRPHLSRPAAIRVLLPRQNQFPSQLPSHHHNCFPDNSPAWLWPLRNWTKLPNQRAKKGSGSFKISNNSCKLAQAGFASGSQIKRRTNGETWTTPAEMEGLHLICQLSASCRLISKTNPEDGLRCPGLPCPFACGLAPLEVLAWQLMIMRGPSY